MAASNIKLALAWVVVSPACNALTMPADHVTSALDNRSQQLECLPAFMASVHAAKLSLKVKNAEQEGHVPVA